MGINSNLPVCTGTASQGTIEDCTVECTISDMQPFTIHFRRPEINRNLNIGSKSNLYDGSYGFDWLRDEYIYDLEPVYELVDSSSGRTLPKKNRLYKGKVDNLIKEYIQLNNKDLKVKAEINKIQAKTGGTYIPSWLSIFPTTHASKKHNDGVDLYLQVEQEEALSTAILSLKDPSAINLEFEADDGIDIQATGIQTLADLIGGDTQELDLKFSDSSSKIKNKKVRRYLDKTKVINIRSSTGNNDVKFIRIKATNTSKTCTKVVGLICIYPNSDSHIYHADINVVPTLIAPLSNSYQLPTIMLNSNPFSIDKFINNHFLNQAMVTTTTQQLPDFELYNKNNFVAHITKEYDYQSTYSMSYKSPTGVLTNIANEHYIPMYKKDSKGDYLLDSNNNLIKNDTSALRDDIIILFEQQQKVTLDDNSNKQTYIFLTDFYIADISLDDQKEIDKITNPGASSGKVNTFGSGNNTQSSIEWGNTVMIFDHGKEDYDVRVIVHELGHSFSLPHTFEIDAYTKHSFYAGYTDNVMDYDKRNINALIEKSATKPIQKKSDYSSQQLSLFKWQWEILRNDRSIRK